MILSEIKNYLMQRGQASLGDIATHFNAPPNAVRGMLEQWMRKGRVRQYMAGAGCGGSCSRCDPLSTEIYQWIGQGQATAPELSVRLPDSCS